MTRTRTITVQALARVEGEGGFTIRVRNGAVESVELRIYEPPRFFEGLLRGRAAAEAPDITARICGICPVAYQMSAVHAIERGLGLTLPPALRALRRLLYCGEWIESHTLHIHMLHAPDFLGFESAVAMAQASPALADVVRRALRIKKIGNRLVSVIGGREIHPINVRLGGFYRVPRREELAALVDELTWARDAAVEVVRWAAGLEFPALAGDYEFVALRHPTEYPMNEGRLVSSRGLDIAPEAFAEGFEEVQVPHSTALQARRRGGGTYLTGPLARWALNADLAHPLVREVAAAHGGLATPEDNPFRSIVVRALEVLQAICDALELIAAYAPPPAPAIEIAWRAGVGHAATEAPRGTLYHRYAWDDAGVLTDAVIVPPTSQNQAQIERDLLRMAPALLHLPRADAALQAEKVIRSFDPCISCATHFLRLTVEEA